MATIFTSSSFEDSPIAKALEVQLLSKGHRTKLPIGKPNVGNQRANISEAIRESRALIAILSKSGNFAENVVGEIGAARILADMRGMLVLPVLLDAGAKPPELVNDLYCFRLFDEDVPRLAGELDAAIREPVRPLPRIFISHRHEDRTTAAALMELLKLAFQAEKTDIRCTSVTSHGLETGVQTSSQLRSSIVGAEVVIGILTPNVSRSDYVLLELGAAWGCGIPTLPVTANGASATDVPPILDELHRISLESKDGCLRLIEDIARRTSLLQNEGQADRVSEAAATVAAVAEIRSTEART
jgi:hypothetical protein